MIENSSEAGRGLSSRFILPRRERPLLAGNIEMCTAIDQHSTQRGVKQALSPH